MLMAARPLLAPASGSSAALRRGLLARPSPRRLTTSSGGGSSSGSSSSRALRSLLLSTVMATTTASAMRVICYGDSLTAGTSPPLDTLHPYAPYLERAISTTAPASLVRHLGLPGVTATAMLQYVDDEQSGLRSLLKRASPHLALILAGTNDLGYNSESEPIVRALCGLHQVCHDLDVPTVAIGIPPSAYQAQNAAAAELASSVNREMREWCEARGDMPTWTRTFCAGTVVKSGGGGGAFATFVDHPIATWARDDELWAPDGLHFSPEGYQRLGEGLASNVADRLQTLSSAQAGSS